MIQENLTIKNQTSLLPDAELYLIKSYLDEETCSIFLNYFQSNSITSRFKYQKLTYYNTKKEIIETKNNSRQSFWFGNGPKYTQKLTDRLYYNSNGEKINLQNNELQHFEWEQPILDLKLNMEKEFNIVFNACLVGKYNCSNDYIKYHSDLGYGLNKEPVIASISFGTSTNFKIKSNETKQEYNVMLDKGDLLIMGEYANTKYKHMVPKNKKLNTNNPRINLTFRYYN